MKTTRNGAREHTIERTRNTSAITEDNTVKTTGNGETNIGEAIKPRMRNRSNKDLKDCGKNPANRLWNRISRVLESGTRDLRKCELNR